MTQLSEKMNSLEEQRKLRHELSTIESVLKSSLRLAKHDSKNQAALELADQAVQRLSIVIRDLDTQIVGVDEEGVLREPSARESSKDT